MHPAESIYFISGEKKPKKKKKKKKQRKTKKKMRIGGGISTIYTGKRVAAVP